MAQPVPAAASPLPVAYMVLHAPPQTLSKLLAHRDEVKVTTRMPTEMYWPYNTEPYIWPQSTQDRLCQGQIAYSFLHPQEGDGEGLERACAIASLHQKCPEPSTEARITGRRQEALKGESSRDGQERTDFPLHGKPGSKQNP